VGGRIDASLICVFGKNIEEGKMRKNQTGAMEYGRDCV